ncbi:vacuolar protein sorting-associated protein 33B isoform X3 [Cryptotermes secundus]|uniref:vacuolar protein sorting-associated protein 33B isoform X3 n=1 Tax=Cryptotermes secundus TaxID=105785 RepID=UPI000CD7DA02|nr:vacuolar protein sorting-associated protein 33B isoform X3 [Cryptotermes secundus]
MQNTVEYRLDALHQISQRKLGEILKKIPGKKELIIDPVLMKPLECITGVQFLRSHGVDKIFKFEKSGVSCVNSQLVYMIYSDLITAKYVCNQINASIHQNHQNSYNLILVPSDLVAIQQLLEEEGVHGILTVHIFPWELIRLDGGVMSYELPGLFKMLFVDGDRSMLPAVARSLWSLQLLLGRIPLTLTQGRFSLQVRTMVDTLCNELGTSDKADSDISCMLVVDRDVDYASVLLTPVTYVGLLDEVFGISSGTIELDSRVTGNQDGAREKINYQLSSTDAIYNEIKNRHFSDVFPFLSSKTKEMQSEYNRSCNVALQEMKHYVATELRKVTALKRSLAYHIGACEVIIGEMGHRYESLHQVEKNMLEGRNKRENFSYVEECLATSGKLTSLRLLCLLALTQDGLSVDEATLLKTQFLHCCGYEHLVTFHNLEKLGLLTPQGMGTNPGNTSSGASDAAGKLAGRVAQVVSQLPKRTGAFQAFAYKLKLFPEASEEYDLKQPKDPGYVFGGLYVPVVCRLVSLLIKKELSPEEIVKLGPSIGTTSWAKKPGDWDMNRYCYVWKTVMFIPCQILL